MDKSRLLTAKETAIESELGNIAKGTFIASLDHKLRNPMNSIMGMLNLLDETELDEHQQGYVDSALEACKHLLNTINQVTDFPLNSYRLELQDQPFDLFKAGKNVIKAFSGLASEKNISLQFECEADTPTLLNGDPLKLQQVLAKIIENALNFTDKGSVKLTVGTEKNKNHKVMIFFKIIDTGPGISEKELSNIFDFTNNIFSKKTNIRRTILELAVCRKIVQEMEGNIEIFSEKGEGTEVLIHIPFIKTSSKVINEISKEQEVIIKKDADSFKCFNGLKVLLAEDDLINQSLAVAFLNKLGGSVDTADNGKQAVKLFSEKEYDIIFMDCEMPEMDGFDAAKEIRNLEKENNTTRKTPIIAMTAYAGRGDRDNCIASGMDDHVPKPITVDILQDIAEKYIFQKG